jgi:hypothetical protein
MGDGISFVPIYKNKMINNIWQSCKRRICNKILRQGNQIGPLHFNEAHSLVKQITVEPKCWENLVTPTQLDCSNMEWDDPLLSNCRTIMIEYGLTMAILNKTFPNYTYYYQVFWIHILACLWHYSLCLQQFHASCFIISPKIS